MKMRSTIAGVALAGSLVLGAAAAAWAGPMDPGHTSTGMDPGGIMGTTPTMTGPGDMMSTTPTMTGPGGMMGDESEYGTGMGFGSGMGTGMGAGTGMGSGMGSGTGMGSTTGQTGAMGPGHMFTDVPSDAWYGTYAEHMAEHGFMSGFADGTFGADQGITRGQFAAVMARMMGLDPVDGTIDFSDLQGYWGAGAVQSLAQLGVVSGFADGTFGPYAMITRAQMATMMDRAWEYMSQGAGPMTAEEMQQIRDQMRQQLHDVTGTWAEDHIAHMYQMGVIHGDQQGLFHPQDATNRGQAAAMMWRWYEAVQQ